MNFGQALEHAKQGKKIARKGWNGKNMWMLLIPGLSKHDIWPENVKDVAVQNDGKVEILPYMIMKTVDNKIVDGCVVSQTDMLADDWFVVELKSLHYDLLHIKENIMLTVELYEDFVRGVGEIGDGVVDLDITTQTVGSVDNITAEVGEDPTVVLKDLEETITKLKNENDELREVVEYEREKLERFKERIQRHINYQYKMLTYNKKDKENKK